LNGTLVESHLHYKHVVVASPSQSVQIQTHKVRNAVGTEVRLLQRDPTQIFVHTFQHLGLPSFIRSMAFSYSHSPSYLPESLGPTGPGTEIRLPGILHSPAAHRRIHSRVETLRFRHNLSWCWWIVTARVRPPWE